MATQNPELRKKFSGRPEFVVNFFEYIAEEVREILASLGFTKLEEAVGRSDLLDKVEAIAHWKARGLDFTKLFHRPKVAEGTAIRHVEVQHHPIDTVLDRRLIEGAKRAIETGEPVVVTDTIRNSDRAAGAMLSGMVAKAHGHEGLSDDTIVVKLAGTAGQSFGVWNVGGLNLLLEGDANDYVGKGMTGGKLVIRPPSGSDFKTQDTSIVGLSLIHI